MPAVCAAYVLCNAVVAVVHWLFPPIGGETSLAGTHYDKSDPVGQEHVREDCWQAVPCAPPVCFLSAGSE